MGPEPEFDDMVGFVDPFGFDGRFGFWTTVDLWHARMQQLLLLFYDGRGLERERRSNSSSTLTISHMYDICTRHHCEYLVVDALWMLKAHWA